MKREVGLFMIKKINQTRQPGRSLPRWFTSSVRAILIKPFIYIVTLFFLLILWHWGSVSLNMAMLPTPKATLIALARLFTANTIQSHLLASFNRVFLSILLSFVIGLPLGLVIGYERFPDRFFSPLIYLLYPIPKIVFMPLIIVFMGLGDASRIFLIVFILVFQVIVTTRDAVKKIPEEMLDSLYALGGKRRNAYLHVLLPSALADVLTTLRLSVGMAFAVLFLAETYAARLGLGYLIMDSWTRVEYADMFAAILTMALLGVAFFLVIDLLEWRLCRWRRS